MDTDHTASTDNFERAQPESSVQLPGGVTVQWQDWRQGGCFECSGRAEDLIACGAASADMLIMNKQHARGPRRIRCDADGDRYVVTRYWRSTDERREPCPPYRWYQVRRFKKAGDRLPGGTEAVMATMRYRRWEMVRHQARHQQQVTRSVQGARPQLRLVVDNTEGRS